MDTTALRDAGLTEGEIKVYLALLELGPSTTGPIIDRSGIARSRAYQILDKLVQKGIVSYITKEKTKYYQAAEPNRILDYLDEKEKKLEKTKKKVEGLIPELLLKQRMAKETEVKVFEGFKGMVTAHEHAYDKLKSGDEYFYMGIPPEQPPYFHAYWQKDHMRRAKAGIKTRMLFHPKTERSILKNRNSYPLCDARYMPTEITTPAWFMGYKDVALIGFPSTKPVTVEIINKEIADSFRAYFEEFWKKSKSFK